MTDTDPFSSNSLGALHLALVAAIVGYLIFCISHAWSVWRKRHQDGSRRSAGPWIGTLFWLGIAATFGGWLDRELAWREGIVTGTDFFVVRAEPMASPIVTPHISVRAGDPLVRFDASDLADRRSQIVGDIGVASHQIEQLRLSAPNLDPELIRRQEQLSEDQRTRLSLLDGTQPGDVSVEHARLTRDQAQLDRINKLYQQGFSTKATLEGIQAETRIAAGELARRRSLLQSATAEQSGLAQYDRLIAADRVRAIGAQTAQIQQQKARIGEYFGELAALDRRITVRAPFVGTVVYRHPAPSLVHAGEPILALARGPGFIAKVDVPAGDVRYLSLGQPLRLKLKDALVGEELAGRLHSIESAPDDPGRRTIEILCQLPAEQVMALNGEPVRVSLLWRPPLLRDTIVDMGLLLILIAAALAIATRKQAVPEPSSEPQQPWKAGWWLTQKEDEVFNLGVRFGEELASGDVRNATIGSVEILIGRQPMTAPLILSAGVLTVYSGVPPLDRVKTAEPTRLARIIDLLELSEAPNQQIIGAGV